MLRRALSICLTDPKSPIRDGVSIDFSPVGEEERGSVRVMYWPLLHALNALKMSRAFRQKILGAVRKAIADADRPESDAVRSPSALDWEKTSESFVKGERVLVPKVGGTQWPKDDRLLLAFVVCEFIGHVDLLEGVFGGDHPLSEDESIVRSIETLSQTAKEGRSLIGEARAKRVLPVDEAMGVLNAPLNVFAGAVLGQRSGREGDLGMAFREYTDQIAGWIKHLGGRTQRCRWLCGWREGWLAMRTYLGPGRDLRFLQQRSIRYLFELWCFMELAYELAASGYRELVQCSVLQTGRDGATFSSGETFDVYFSFDGRRSNVRRLEKIFSETTIEWFIENLEYEPASIVIDTKYRKKWRSEDNLKVLGYMNDFGVLHGVVIFSAELRLEAYSQGGGDQRFVRSRLGASREKVFCAMTLVPELGEMDRNRQVLKRLISEVIVPALGMRG